MAAHTPRPLPAPTGPDPVGVRLAGLTADALDDSRIPLSTELALRIVVLDQAIRAEAAGISDALHALIATERARPFKSRLVGLRRAVHQSGRAVHQGARVRALLDAAAPPEVTGPELTDRIHRHTARCDTRSELFAQLAQALPVETRSAAAALGRLAQDPAFAIGLGYASPDLYDDLLRWLDRERIAPGRRPLDRAAVRLAKYAARAVAKPSPLTTFAASGFGRWTGNAGGMGDLGGTGAADAAVRLESTARATVVEVGLLSLSRIAAALAHLPELDAVVRLRVNPFATLVPSADGDRWLFTVPGPSGEVRSLPATAALAAILAATQETGTPAGLRALLGAPAESAASSASTPSAASVDGAGRADAVVAQLVRLGLLEVHLELPDQGLTASALSAWLDKQQPGQDRGERLTGLLDDLRAIRDQLDAARSAAPTEHRGIATTLHTRTTAAAQRLGLLGPAEEPEHGTRYFHHTVVTGTAATLDRDSWQSALADLALVPSLLAPFDTLGPRRAALHHRAVSAYGPGFRQPFTGFLRDFGSWWADATTDTPTERDARRQAALRRLIADTPQDADGTVRLAPQAVRALCSDWPDPHTVGDRHAYYVQALPATPAGLGLVLNTVTCGHGTGRTRVAQLLGTTLDITFDVTFDAPHPCPGATQYVEFDAAFGSALNQRVPATRDAIDLDGSHSDRAPGHLLRPADLEVVHDQQAQLLHLVHRDTGRVVRPLHLGLLATPLLPLPARLLVEAFGQTSYAFWSDWPQLWRSDQPDQDPGQEQVQDPGPVVAPVPDATPDPGAPRRVARLALGSVVLRRACWFVERGQAPARTAGESDAVYLVRVHAWREAHGLPLHCFLRTLTPRPAEGFAGPALHDKDRKPVYLDFTHPHLLRVFEHAAATGRPLLLTEALPELHDAPAHRDGRRHAVEFLIELPAMTDKLTDPTAPTTERRPDAC
ncbi:lantibiotic dehydratase [Kitasatospora kifunensis]|uniref:Lantibiotic dehydratase N-terminal domain-containing protein n=1 Tax=Kitasatospora kifunensis TaxID=58351 RepID=A0A7W7RBM7_KITKI|nr:lantibiotic dehydratase [Kitasatospora kifunensis]MBB4928983.1 hypothetical protein [Kitasatospora kifunensis]